MEEIFTKVQAYQIDCQCPVCKTGFMRPTGMMLASNPPQYTHICTNKECTYSENVYSKTYPYIDFKPL